MINKFCGGCKKQKQIQDFNKNRRKKDGLQTICRICSNKKSRDYYSKNKEHHKRIITNRKKKIISTNRNKIMQFLANEACKDCYEKDLLVLEFDHKTSVEKRNDISSMLRSGCSWNSIKKEINKCDVRCANCHNRKTHKENNSYRFKWVRNSIGRVGDF